MARSELHPDEEWLWSSGGHVVARVSRVCSRSGDHVMCNVRIEAYLRYISDESGDIPGMPMVQVVLWLESVKTWVAMR
jgi:hypothetical protein